MKYVHLQKKEMSEFISSIFKQATAQGFKSNVVKPLMGMFTLFVIATVVLYWLEVPYFSIAMGCLMMIAGIVFLIAYLYCLFKNPDYLRSEKFVVEKMAIEKAALGNSMTPMIKLPETEYVIVDSNKENNKNIQEEEE